MSFSEFDAVYRSSIDEIWPHWNEEMQTEIARHCHAWSPGRTDFYNYLQLSAVRFYKAWQVLGASGARSLCDVGGFWGVWPVTAKKLGVEHVAMTESLQYYSGSFDPLFDQIRASGVTIYDHDPFSKEAVLDERFDLVTVMAVLEHYPHSLRTFFANVKTLIAGTGRIFIEVPNIAYWPKRTALMNGVSPLASVSDIYASEEPFIGHHHEFTIQELRDLARLTGLRIVKEETFNYSLADANRLKLFLRYPIMSLAFRLAPAARECIAVLCEPGANL